MAIQDIMNETPLTTLQMAIRMSILKISNNDVSFNAENKHAMTNIPLESANFYNRQSSD